MTLNEWMQLPRSFVGCVYEPAPIAALASQVDAAYERGDLQTAGDLDAQLAEMRAEFEHAMADVDEMEGTEDEEAGVDVQLAIAFDAYRCGGKAPLMTANDALQNMRSVIEDAGGKPGSDDQVLEAARGAYNMHHQRRQRRALTRQRHQEAMQ